MPRLGVNGAPWVSRVLATALIGWVAYLLFRAGQALPGKCTEVPLGMDPTGAMEDTLLIGDQLLAGVLGVSTPSRGDIILFRYPMDMRQTFVKRCMGVPGDRIKLANEESARDMLEHHVVNGELAVPPGSFAMGDNRDASLDSRYWGFVPRDNIMGKPLIVYWSYGAPTEVLAGSAIGIDRIVERYRNFFTKTRWRRICMPVRGYAIN